MKEKLCKERHFGVSKTLKTQEILGALSPPPPSSGCWQMTEVKDHDIWLRVMSSQLKWAGLVFIGEKIQPVEVCQARVGEVAEPEVVEPPCSNSMGNSISKWFTLNIISSHLFPRHGFGLNVQPGPWQRNFVDACFLQFHMFPTVWSYTTTIGLLDLYIQVCLKVTSTVT